MRTKDFETWEDVSEKMSFPERMRHGTVLSVSDDVLGKLLEEK
jgi:hypothetical protein